MEVLSPRISLNQRDITHFGVQIRGFHRALYRNLTPLPPSGDPWFHGPWFVYPEEISHTPTRLFLERELFMSNIHDTNPMRSIIGRCSVLPLPDYSRKRLSEFSESDVFVVESRYLEAEGEIRKIVKTAALRPPQLSRDVQEDEVFVFHSEIHPRKVVGKKTTLNFLWQIC